MEDRFRTIRLDVQDRGLDEWPRPPLFNFESIADLPRGRCAKENPRCASRIQWHVYNWPVCCKLVHFNLSEVHPKIRPLFALTYVNFYIFLIMAMVKAMTLVLLFMTESEARPIASWEVAVSLISLSCLAALKCLQFYSAYRGFFYDDFFKLVFKFVALGFVVYASLNLLLDNAFLDGVQTILRFAALSAEQPNSEFIVFLLILQSIFNGAGLVIDLTAIIYFKILESKYDD